MEGYFSMDYFAVDDEDEGDECAHTMSCSCETCMQNYPERFDEDWNNYYANDDPPHPSEY